MATILRATLFYWILLCTLRLLGRRAASQLSPFELIVLFLLGGISIQAIVADDRSTINALTGVFTIAANHMLVSAWKQRNESFRKLVDGTAVPVLSHGELDKRRLHGLRMLEEDVMAAARQGGAGKLDILSSQS
jgi:uncharacterized membrane protein YcaP (DUF421 family)